MSREIKFRAFNNATGKMSNWDFISKVRNFHKLISLKHVELMQFTGLKDKNGVDIYEGDIITDWNGVREVKFTICDTEQGYYIELDDSDLEVLGNIHENPELL